MAAKISNVSDEFDKSQFVSLAVGGLNDLELKPRAKHIARAIFLAFGRDYDKAIIPLVQSLKKPISEKDNLGKYPSFYFMPFSEFIIEYGLDSYNASMQANYELTKVFTAEFSIRPFLLNHTEKTLKLLHAWAMDENLHVRRLVSEGTRTRLPWGGRLANFQKDPTPVFALLEKLKHDPELYVRRSVANNLNDLAKDHPKRVIETLSIWQANGGGNKNTGWIIKHASRTLIKNGHRDALRLLGFDPNASIAICDVEVSEAVQFGEKLLMSFSLKNNDKRKQKLMIDFAIYFKKANGTLAPKVFKLKELILKSGEEQRITKNHSIKPITTRKYYGGFHEVAIIVNGVEGKHFPFELVGID